MRPHALSIDGINSDTRTNRVLFFSPGNPVDLQPCLYVGADLPIAQLVMSTSQKDVVSLALRHKWQEITGGSLEEYNQEGIPARLRALGKEGLPEATLFIGPAVIMTVALEQSDLIKTLENIIVWGGTGRIVLSRNILKYIAPFVDSKLFMILSKLTRPVFRKTDDINLRNAVVALKLHELADDSVALFGATHANGDDLWNDEQKQVEVIRASIESVAAGAAEIASKDSARNGKKVGQQLRDGLNDFYSRLTVWRYGDIQRGQTLREINRKVSRKQHLSPRISQIVEETVRNI